MASSAAGELLQRGVWRAPYLVAGIPVLIAVDSFGVVRKHVKLERGIDEYRAAGWLAELLDRVDPPRQLRLVRPSPVTPPAPPDPRSLEGKRRYWSQLTKAAVRKIPRLTDI